MGATEEILGQFLGDDAFPVAWASDAERDLFWVYDDLHIPHPVSPMFFDIGGWWLSCDHMFRRFGTPFAVDWLAKNVNGYVYTTAIPADPRPAHRRHGVQRPLRRAGAARRGVRRPRWAPTSTPSCPSTATHFADWWRDRLVPEMQRNFAYLEGQLDAADGDDAGRGRVRARGRDRHPRPALEDPLDAELRPAVRDAQPAGGHGADARQRSTRSCSAGCRTRRRTATGTRSRRCGG